MCILYGGFPKGTWKSKIDDAVYYGDCHTAALVLKVGYASYECQVRIAFVNGDLNDHRTG